MSTQTLPNGRPVRKETWKELEAQGIKRCCAMFKNGMQCRRRVAAPFDSWCAKHGPIIEAVCAEAIKALE